MTANIAVGESFEIFYRGTQRIKNGWSGFKIGLLPQGLDQFREDHPFRFGEFRGVNGNHDPLNTIIFIGEGSFFFSMGSTRQQHVGIFFSPMNSFPYQYRRSIPLC